MQQTYMSTRGLTSANNIVQIDGLMINGLDGDGAVQQYINNQMIQEMSYTTAGAGADVSPGGVRVNVVMKDGGNQLQRHVLRRLERRHVAVEQPDRRAARPRACAPRTRSRRSTNSAAASAARSSATRSGSSPPAASAASTRRSPTRSTCRRARPTPTARPGASRASRASTTRTSTARRCRLTWQISPRNKFSLYYEEVDKFRGHGMNAGDDPADGVADLDVAALQRRGAAATPARSAASCCSTPAIRSTTRSTSSPTRTASTRTAAPPQWYAGASRRDATLVTLRSGLANWGGRYPDRFNTQASMSYVTGAHNVKVGLPVQLGHLRQHARDQRRPAAGLLERRAELGHRLQHAAALQGRPARRPRHLRAGHLDDQSVDAERRHPLRALEARSVEAGVGRGPLHRRAQFRSDPDADLEGPGAALRRSSTTCSATPRPRSSSASTATTNRARRSSPIATTRWR